MTALASPSGNEASYADIVERMFREFEDRLELKVILDVVNDCRRDLQGTPAGAMPELTERLARHRLSTLALAATPGGARSDPDPVPPLPRPTVDRMEEPMTEPHSTHAEQQDPALREEVDRSHLEDDDAAEFEADIDEAQADIPGDDEVPPNLL